MAAAEVCVGVVFPLVKCATRAQVDAHLRIRKGGKKDGTRMALVFFSLSLSISTSFSIQRAIATRKVRIEHLYIYL